MSPGDSRELRGTMRPWRSRRCQASVVLPGRSSRQDVGLPRRALDQAIFASCGAHGPIEWPPHLLKAG
eukprot:scaffold1142_cov387-Prasinococcus_capsulatus_cf.AAC.1